MISQQPIRACYTQSNFSSITIDPTSETVLMLPVLAVVGVMENDEIADVRMI